MNVKTTLFAFVIIMASCSDKTNNNEVALKTLNERSKKCIAVMNEADALKNKAITNGNTAMITAYQKTIDSAAMENAKIGQEMMQLK
jgi:hypothetical protein